MLSARMTRVILMLESSVSITFSNRIVKGGTPINDGFFQLRVMLSCPIYVETRSVGSFGRAIKIK